MKLLNNGQTLQETDIDALLGAGTVKPDPTKKPDPNKAPASLGASTAILNFLHGLKTNTGEAILAAGDQGAQDLQKNAEVQGGPAGTGTKLKSEVETGLHVAGDFAGGVFAPLTGAIKTITDSASDNPDVQKFAQHPLVSGLLQHTDAIQSKLGDFAAKHPEAARDLGDIFNIASLAAGGEGGAGAGGAAAKVAKAGAEAGGDLAARAGAAVAAKGAKATQGKLAEMLSPRLDAAEATKAVSEGRVTGPKGPLGDIKMERSLTTKDGEPTRLGKMVAAVQDIVKPDMPFSKAAKAVNDAIGTEAEKLKADIAGEDHPYTYKELNSRLSNVEKPELIKSGDATVQKTARRIVNKFLEISRDKKATISNLLDSRKEFDAWVAKEYPNLYNTDSMTGVKLMVKNVRDEANKFIEENLPEGFGYRESLQKQSLMYDALENLSEKAAKGAPKTQGEIGTNALQRFGKRHPKLTKTAGTVGTIGGSVLLGDELGQHLP